MTPRRAMTPFPRPRVQGSGFRVQGFRILWLLGLFFV